MDIVRKSMEGSICFAILLDRQVVGFARVISDKSTFAYICDLFVLSEHRGNGLGKWLVEFIMNHQELQNLRRWALATKDAHGLYQQYGFCDLAAPKMFMEKLTPYTQDL